MRLSEFAQREPIDDITAHTLNALWASRFDGELRFGTEGPGQRWRAHDLLSAYFDPGLGAAGRTYLRDGFRNTPRRSRRAAQWLLGTALASVPGLRLSSREAFYVEGDRPTKDLLVVPGNRRLRLLDFGQGRAVVATKRGYDSASLSTELRVRSERQAKFMVPVLEADAEAGWLEEPLLQGWPLPRAPRDHDQRASLLWARDAVAQWAEPECRSEDTADYLGPLLERLKVDLQTAHERFPDLHRVPPAWQQQLESWALEAPRVEVLPSHGDLQAGNLWLQADRSSVLILDWERSAPRSRGYDGRVQELATRSPVGLGARIIGGVREAGSDRSALSLFLLEDWQWFLTEALDVPGARCPGGLATLHAELSACASELVSGGLT